MKFEVTFIDENENGEKFWNTIILEAKNKSRKAIWEAAKKEGIKGINVESWKEVK
jgi:hypothetical protein